MKVYKRLVAVTLREERVLVARWFAVALGHPYKRLFYLRCDGCGVRKSSKVRLRYYRTRDMDFCDSCWGYR